MSESPKNLDAIIVGARVAGSAAAILLARAGHRVLVIDKDSFPSDRLSTHIVLSGGTKVLQRMGVLEMLERLGGVRLRGCARLAPTSTTAANSQPLAQTIAVCVSGEC